MAAKTVQAIRIAVTRGDCFPGNRPDGSSNTGTYFVCSTKDWKEFEHFFPKTGNFYFSLAKIRIYVKTLELVAGKYKDIYPDHYTSLKDFGKAFFEVEEDPICGVDLRNNDARIFMRFTDNSNPFVLAFRHILYSDLSAIALEITSKGIAVYPEVDFEAKGPKVTKKEISFEDLICE